MRRAALLCLLLGCADEKVAPPPDAATPEAAPALAVLGVYAASETSFAWMSDGTVRAWGANGFGQLGWGAPHQDTATPVQVEGLLDVDTVFAGGTKLTTTACARIKGGSVKCWGHADLIPGRTDHTAMPVDVPALAGSKDISIGGGHACAVHSDGTVSCWGYGAFGALGLGADKRNKRVAKPTKVHGLTGAVAVVAGQNHSCVLHDDGGASCWGGNFEGQSDPKNPGMNHDVVAPLRVEGVADAVAIAAGADVTCALGKDATVTCWGENFRGTVGALPNSSGPKALWNGFADHACIIRNEGELWCWGDNGWGEAGGDPKERTIREPTRVAGLSRVTSVATAFKSKHTCVVIGGKAQCWGRNRFGGLGNGNVIDQRQPRDVVAVNSEALPEPRAGHDGVESTGEPTVFGSLPDGCAQPGKFAMRIENEPLVTDFELVHAEAARRPRKTADGSEGTRYVVTLRNYTYDRKSLVWQRDQHPRGRQVVLTLTFEQNHVTKEGRKSIRSARPVDAGVFSMSPELGGRVTVGDRRELEANGRVRRIKFDFRHGPDAYPGATITHVGEGWICGELSLKNGDNAVNGTFAAPIRAAK